MLKNKKRVLINIFMICIVILSIRIYIDNNVFTISKIELIDEELPMIFNETRILQISDLHSKSYGEDNKVLLTKIEEISPDYIFMTGDMVSSRDTDFSVFYSLAEAIGPKYNCYYILGNHELDLSNKLRKDIYNTLENDGITVLDNEMVKLTKDENEINLYGMWYNPKFYIKEDFSIEDMKKIMGTAEDGFNILLTHNPDDFEIYAKWGADLTFSGHVHGGMVRLPFVRRCNFSK